MTFWISALNGGAVSIFGGILSAQFSGGIRTRKNRLSFLCGMLLLLILQGFVYCFLDEKVTRYIYPLTVHLPIFCMLCALTGKKLWSAICVLTAYLCCQPRRWLALLVAMLLSGGKLMRETVELILTFPILFLLIRFVAPAFHRLADHPARYHAHFGVLPLTYYIFDYLAVVYTDLLTVGNPVAVEFMPFVCCAAYLVFILYNAHNEQKHNQLQQIKNCLDLQLAQSVQQIDAMRESQELTRHYRHDLRHHLQYVSACIDNGQLKQAQTYISEICQEMEERKLQRYCENETVNLILSSFAGRAKKSNISFQVQGALGAQLKLTDSDLCVLLSNALENALHACQACYEAGTNCSIDIQFYERNDKLFLQITNTCVQAVCFQDGIPVSDCPGHGIGVQSICAIVKRYDGMHTFAVRDGYFIVRIAV